MLQLHFFAVSAWIGVLGLETVMELYCRKSPERLRTAAGVHAWGDRLVEGPLVIVVIVTGALLLAERWQVASPLLLLKAGLGLVAALVNLYCLCLTHMRLLDAADDAALVRWTRKVALTGYAIPVVLLSFAMGISLSQ